MARFPEPMDAEEETSVADLLPDSPSCFVVRSVLHRHAGRAWTSEPGDPLRALVVERANGSGSCYCLGTDTVEIVRLLGGAPEWRWIRCLPEQSGALRNALEAGKGRPVRSTRERVQRLIAPVVPIAHPWVRRLGEDDAELLDGAAPALRPVGFQSSLAALSGGVAAGAIVEGHLVGSVSMGLSSADHAELTGGVLLPWRGRGIGTASISLVAATLQERALIPVWTIDDDDPIARRVSDKLGFETCGETVRFVREPRS